MTLSTGILDGMTARPRNEAERLAPPLKHHFRELDSLRGLAALAVVFYHWYHLFPDGAMPKWLQLLLGTTPLQFFGWGHSAVVLFFVLSGFVLSLPQVRGSAVHYPSYLVKRVCRIYLPYAVGLAFAVLGCWRFHGLNAYDLWFRRTWNETPSALLILRHLLLVGAYRKDAFNTAFWSLIQEMRVSLFFPALCWIVLRLRAIGALTLVSGLLGLEVVSEQRDMLSGETLVCVADFTIGIVVALYLPLLRSWLQARSRVIYWALFALSLALFIYTPWLAFHAHVHALAIDGGIAVGAAGIILFHLTDRHLSRLVLGPVVSFLGRISYSLYLLRGTVLWLLAYLLHGRLALGVWLLPYVGLSVVGAALMYRWIELPSISLGRLLATQLLPSLGLSEPRALATPMTMEAGWQSPASATQDRSSNTLDAAAEGADRHQAGSSF